MAQTNIEIEIFQILSNMGIAKKALTNNASFIKDLGLDSLDFAELVLELEQVFSLEIPILEVEHLQTVQETILYIDGKLSAGN